ncbi:MAG: type II secretion system protein [Candidatus Omnitrophica bacterium]|nr:type II secretion system protein [Candidatus Omnitrophota bacterium]
MIKKEKSFTLLELITATVIISILLTIFLPKFIKNIAKSRQVEAIDILTRMYKSYRILAIDEIIDSATGNFINGTTPADRFNPDESNVFPDSTGRSDFSWKALGFSQNVNYKYNNLYFSYDFLKSSETSATGTGRVGTGRPPSSAGIIAVAWLKTSSDKPWGELFSVDFNKYVFIFMNNGTIVKSIDYQ